MCRGDAAFLSNYFDQLFLLLQLRLISKSTCYETDCVTGHSDGSVDGAYKHRLHSTREAQKGTQVHLYDPPIAGLSVSVDLWQYLTPLPWLIASAEVRTSRRRYVTRLISGAHHLYKIAFDCVRGRGMRLFNNILVSVHLKPNSITLAGSELVRAEIWPII